MQYDVWIDLPDGSEHHIEDLRSGCQGGSIIEGMSALLSFLGASAESYRYEMSTGRTSDNRDLFDPAIVEWAYQHDDEIGMMQLEIEETDSVLVEE